MVLMVDEYIFIFCVIKLFTDDHSASLVQLSCLHLLVPVFCPPPAQSLSSPSNLYMANNQNVICS